MSPPALGSSACGWRLAQRGGFDGRARPWTWPAAVGAAVGSLAAWWAGGALEALLFGVSPTDAGAYAVAVAACLVVTLAGSVRPAWRAAAIDPIEALRRE